MIRRFAASLLCLAALLGSAGAQTLSNMPPNTVAGRLGAGVPGPAQAIPFATFGAQIAPFIPGISSNNPGNPSGAVQYNNSGAFGAVTGATSNGTAITFASGDLILSGSSSGTTIFNAAATAGTGTMTLPTGTDTLAGLATTQTFSGTETFSGTQNFTGTFESGGNTMTFPASAATLAGLGVIQTWTAAQTFAAGDLLLGGATSGTTTLNATSTASGTLTLPAATDQLIARATTDTLTNKTYDTGGTGNVFKISGTTVTGISGNTGTVGTTSGTLTSGHCVSINSGNFVDAGGACTTGGGGGTVSSGTAGQFTWYASSGTTVAGSSTWTDNSTVLKATESVDATSVGLATEIANATSTGTTNGSLAKLTGAPSKAVITTTSDAQGAIGVVQTGGGTSGNAVIVVAGQVSCSFDGATTAGHYVQISSTTGGDCTDSGAATLPTSGQVIGRVLSTNASSGSYAIVVDSGLNGAGNAVTGVTNSDGTLTISPTTGAVVASIALGHANTWTAKQSFNNGDLALNGSSSGSTLLEAAATASGTISFPAVTDTVAVLGTADQTLSGGANVTSGSEGTKSSGTFTVDCGAVPLQFFTNGGAFTLAAPSNDGSCDLLDTNNGSAGTITFSGFTVSANTGDALTTTNTNKFIIHIERINSIATYLIKALQ